MRSTQFCEWSPYISSFEGAPPGLVALLKIGQSGETGRAERSKLYRRLYGILWVSFAGLLRLNIAETEMQNFPSFSASGKVGAGCFEGNQPTYVFPAALKDVVRARFLDELNVVSKPDPEGEMVRPYMSPLI